MNPEAPPSADRSTVDPALQAYLLGTVDFEAVLRLQRRLVYQVSSSPNEAAVVVCEHAPLITIGREGSWGHFRCGLDEVLTRWQVRWVNRGGGCVLHLPGQLAIYAVLSLEHLDLGLHAYLEGLQAVLASVLNDFGVRAMPRPGKVGLWVGNRPVAILGVAVRDWVAYYGAVLNVNPDLALFRQVQCGMPGDGPMTSVERERRGPLRMAMVRERLLEHFARHFGFARTSLFFEHPALCRKARSDAIATGS